MLFSHGASNPFYVTGAILLSWIFTVAVSLSCFLLKRFVGENGLNAVEKLSAMILIMLAIQRITEGVKLFLEAA